MPFKKADPRSSGKPILGIPNGHSGMISPWRMRMANVGHCGQMPNPDPPFNFLAFWLKEARRTYDHSSCCYANSISGPTLLLRTLPSSFLPRQPTTRRDTCRALSLTVGYNGLVSLPQCFHNERCLSNRIGNPRCTSLCWAHLPDCCQTSRVAHMALLLPCAIRRAALRRCRPYPHYLSDQSVTDDLVSGARIQSGGRIGVVYLLCGPAITCYSPWFAQRSAQNVHFEAGGVPRTTLVLALSTSLCFAAA